MIQTVLKKFSVGFPFAIFAYAILWWMKEYNLTEIVINIGVVLLFSISVGDLILRRTEYKNFFTK